MSDDTPVEISTNTRRHIGRYTTDMSIDTRPTLDRVLVDMSTDMLADTWSRGSYNRHDPF